MFAPSRRLASRAFLRGCSRCLKSSSIASCSTRAILQTTVPHQSRLNVIPRASFATVSSRSYPTQSPAADEIVEELTELYETARDEFQIASEETEENTVYAEGDREAAQEELAKLKSKYEEVMNSDILLDVREEVKKRTSHRIRELDNAMTALEERAQAHD
ncbi:hypothetical protein EJ08DRAFT_623656 [Tothia fuscella]|uniref:Uncharacterized protein n=1 Tax=Tothia fuscella TaxID=1048955 RepID=A0A9P4U4L5_9PEZI|nr:hypothetical protein EJ08DRAFT_623656 [Tothia fuscella]